MNFILTSGHEAQRCKEQLTACYEGCTESTRGTFEGNESDVDLLMGDDGPENELQAGTYVV